MSFDKSLKSLKIEAMSKLSSHPSSEPDAVPTRPTPIEMAIQKRAAELLQSNTFTSFEGVLKQYASGIIGDVRRAIRLLRNFERRNNEVQDDTNESR